MGECCPKGPCFPSRASWAFLFQPDKRNATSTRRTPAHEPREDTRAKARPLLVRRVRCQPRRRLHQMRRLREAQRHQESPSKRQALAEVHRRLSNRLAHLGLHTVALRLAVNHLDALKSRAPSAHPHGCLSTTRPHRSAHALPWQWPPHGPCPRVPPRWPPRASCRSA